MVICCYCDNALSCASCGREQPDDAAELRNITLEEAAVSLKASYPDNANTNAFCAAIRSLKSGPR